MSMKNRSKNIEALQHSIVSENIDDEALNV